MSGPERGYWGGWCPLVRRLRGEDLANGRILFICSLFALGTLKRNEAVTVEVREDIRRRPYYYY